MPNAYTFSSALPAFPSAVCSSTSARNLSTCSGARPTNVFEERVQLALDRVKVRVCTHALDEVVIEPELLHLVRGFVREDLATKSLQLLLPRKGREGGDVPGSSRVPPGGRRRP